MGISRHPLFPDPDRDKDVPVDAVLVARLQTSFATMQPAAAQIAHGFYTLLFARRPDFRAMFPDDMAAQEKKLMATLAFVVEHLRKPAAVSMRLADLGALHQGLHVKPEHYPIVCDALVTAMMQHSPVPLGPDVERDWKNALLLVSQQMIRGAHARQ
jgi:hemoglobin-like flavoprotein